MSRMVPCFTVFMGTASRGIAVSNGHIEVGGYGSRDTLTAYAVPEGSFTTTSRGITMVSAMPVDDPNACAVLLIKDHSGRGGTWELLAPPEQPCPNYGPILTRQCPRCGGTREHKLLPRTHIMLDSIGKLLARGFVIHDTTGKPAGGPEFLIAAKPCSFSIGITGDTNLPERITITVKEDGTVICKDSREALKRRPL